MINLATLKVGDKVHYQPSHHGSTHWENGWENGMIKEIPDFATDPDAHVGHKCIRVVYNCAGDWDKFKDYTSALTHIRDLKLGWRHE